MRKVTSFILFLLLVLFTSIDAQITQSIVADLPGGYGAMFYNHGSHIARTSDDKLFVVWSDVVNGQVVYAQYDASFQEWLPAATISNAPAGGTANDNAVASDDNGNLFVVWNQLDSSNANYKIMLSKYNGTIWSTPVDLSGSDLQNEEPNVAVGNDGKVIVVWNTDSESDGSEWILSVNSNDGGANWSSPPDTLSSPDGIIGGTSIETARVSLARGSGGKMVATWFESGDATDEIYVTQYDGSDWLGETMVTADDSTTNNRYSTVAVDNGDNIYVAWRGRPGTGSYGIVMKSKAWGDSWSDDLSVIVPYEFSTARPSMVIDANNSIYVTYERAVPADTIGLDEIALIASSDGGASWTDQTPISRASHDCGYVGMEPRVTSSGIDVAWRESFNENQAVGTAGDSVTIVYGHIDLLSTALEDGKHHVAKNFTLEQNYPNPFNPSTQITYTIAAAGNYNLSVYNVLGKLVKTISQANHVPGQYKAEWDGKNNLGKNAASGVYFYKLVGKNLSLTKKMVLMR